MARRVSHEGAECPVARAVDVVGDRWSLLLVRDAFDGITRFSDFQRSLGLARNILASRLKDLVGAGILEVSPGVRVVDTPGFPEDLLPPVRAQVALFELVRDNADDLEWTYLSPPAVITPGERTGAYRTGDHQLLSDGEGNSHISTEDYAVALVDELQRGELTRRLVHVAY